LRKLVCSPPAQLDPQGLGVRPLHFLQKNGTVACTEEGKITSIARAHSKLSARKSR
jgi:hypothetical protein